MFTPYPHQLCRGSKLKLIGGRVDGLFYKYSERIFRHKSVRRSSIDGEKRCTNLNVRYAVGQFLHGRIVPGLAQKVFGLLQDLFNDTLDLVQILVQLPFTLLVIFTGWLFDSRTSERIHGQVYGYQEDPVEYTLYSLECLNSFEFLP